MNRVVLSLLVLAQVSCSEDSSISTPSAVPSAAPVAAAATPAPVAPAVPAPATPGCDPHKVIGTLDAVVNENTVTCHLFVTSWRILGPFPKQEVVDEQEFDLPPGKPASRPAPEVRTPSCDPYQVDVALVSGHVVAARKGGTNGANYGSHEMTEVSKIVTSAPSCVGPSPEPTPTPSPSPTPKPTPTPEPPCEVTHPFEMQWNGPIVTPSSITYTYTVRNGNVRVKLLASPFASDYPDHPKYTKRNVLVESTCNGPAVEGSVSWPLPHPSHNWWFTAERNGSFVGNTPSPLSIIP